ncbi:MAG: phosphotransferase family protein [Acidimicrobiales bacterium]
MSIQPQEEIVDLGGRSSDPPGLDIDRTTAWMSANVAGLQPPFSFGLIAAGSSNLTYRVEDAAGERLILRRPPAIAALASAHDVSREFKVMTALRGTDVPVPDTIAFCADTAITGAPFLVMSYAEGLILRSQASAAHLGAVKCSEAGRRFFDVLARIHTLDVAAVGLGDLSGRGSYVERQLGRWMRQYEASLRGEPDPLLIDLHERLASGAPSDTGTDVQLVHGDYHIDNVVLNPDMSVKAVLDWELAALGHPIADLAWALVFWARPGDAIVMLQDAVTAAPGFPERDELANAYARTSGHPLESLPYFTAFVLWKLACLTQGVLFRAESGGGGGLQQGRPADTIGLRSRVQRLLEAADESARAAGI